MTSDHLSGKLGNVRNLTAVREMSGILLTVREMFPDTFLTFSKIPDTFLDLSVPLCIALKYFIPE